MKFRKIRLGQLGIHETVAFAVEELQKYLKQIDPGLFVEVLLLDEPDEACGDVIWVGLHHSFAVTSCMTVMISKRCRQIWGMRRLSLPWMSTAM